MRKRILLAIMGAGLVAAGLGAGWQWWSVWRFEETTDDAYVHSNITAVAAKVAGHVVELNARDNRPVRQGEVLLRIDDRDYAAKVDGARAAVAAARAALDNLAARIAVQKAAIAIAAAETAAAEAELQRARADLERADSLARSEFASRQRLDNERAAVAKAEAGLRAAAAGEEAAQRQLAVLESERAIAEARLREAEAGLAAAEADLDATVVRAPVDGVVGNRAVNLGQFVRPGAALLSVVPLHQVWVEANFKETQIGRMAPGQRATIAVDAFPGQEVTGTVESLAPASGAQFSLLPPENATGNFTKVVQRIPVRIAVPADNPLAGRLVPGLSVVVTVHLGEPGGPAEASLARLAR